MKLRFGINFEFKLTRDMPEAVHDRESDVVSHVERSLAEDWVHEDKVAPVSRRVVGFVGTPPGVAGRTM